MLEDTFDDVGHTGFRTAAEVMVSILFDFATRSEPREAVAEEHATLAALLGEYPEALRPAYADEIGGGR